MKKYLGSNPVPKGVYINQHTGEFVQLDGEIRLLPGDEHDRFIKIPGGMAMVAGPVFGLVFVMFLPLAGILALLGLAAHKTGLATTNIGRKMLQPVMVGWHPDERE